MRFASFAITALAAATADPAVERGKANVIAFLMHLRKLEMEDQQ